MSRCKAIGCQQPVFFGDALCPECVDLVKPEDIDTPPPLTAPQRYPQYFVGASGVTEMDVYAVHHLFNIQDPSGALQHASKQVLLSYSHVDRKATYRAIRDARDVLTRWLQLNADLACNS